MSDPLGTAVVPLQGAVGGPELLVVVLVFLVLFVPLVVLPIAGLWKTFEKAGQPGWAALVPVYNLYVLVQVAGRPDWWTILFFVPFANFVAGILVPIDVAGNFGKGTGFGVGLVLFPFVFYPLLGFGDAQYAGGAS